MMERYLVDPLFRKTCIKKLLISLRLEIVADFEGVTSPYAVYVITADLRALDRPTRRFGDG
jgi:hypothetical protein